MRDMRHRTLCTYQFSVGLDSYKIEAIDTNICGNLSNSYHDSVECLLFERFLLSPFRRWWKTKTSKCVGIKNEKFTTVLPMADHKWYPKLVRLISVDHDTKPLNTHKNFYSKPNTKGKHFFLHSEWASTLDGPIVKAVLGIRIRVILSW